MTAHAKLLDTISCIYFKQFTMHALVLFTDAVRLASTKGQLDTVKYLVEVHHFDPKCKLNKSC